MEPKNVVVSIVLGILILAIGVVSGIFYQAQKTPETVIAPPTGTVAGVPQAIKDLSSKVVPSISAYGVVSKISGKNITLNQGGDMMTITLTSDAKVYSFISSTPGTAGSSVSKQITLGEIKVGDNLSINIQVLPTGQIAGISAIILPVAK